MNKKLTTILAASLALGAIAGAAASPLVEADWLADNLDDPNTVIIDLRKAEDYAAGHIPGAVSATYGAFGWREEIDGVIGMLPALETINAKIGSLGVTPDKRVIVVPYGNNSSDVGSATRVYWTFKTLGHDDVSLLDGGYNSWNASDLPLSTDPVDPLAAPAYPGAVDEALVIDTANLLEQIDSGAVLPVDARTDVQWEGEEKHPKARIPGGIPSAARLPQAELVDPETGKFLSGDEVIAVAKSYGWEIDGSKPLVTYCNTGHWASTIWFALSEVANVEGVKLYDGSMVAWTKDESNPTINTPSRLELFFKEITS